MTYDEIIAAHGDPEQGAGGSTAVHAARAAAEAHRQARDAILVAPTAENRNLLASEEREFNRHRSQVTLCESLADAYGERERRANQAYAQAGQTGQRAAGGARVGVDEPYRRGSGFSFFQDLARQAATHDPVATRRLMEHAEQTDNAMRGGDVPREFRVNPNRTPGQMGNFAPPLWLIDEYVTLARAGRVAANLPMLLELPGGTDSINLPKITGGSATAIQTADAATVQSTDMTDAADTAPVRTIAGQQDFALQLLDQSPINFDEVIIRDLLADLGQKTDVQVINGSGASGQVTGWLNVSGINAVTFTNASPTLQLLWPILTQAKSQTEKGVFAPCDAVLLHPSVWNWCLGQLDGASGTAGRPLIVSTGTTTGLNPMAVSDSNAAQGSVGTLLNLPAYTSANVPTNLGAGSNESRIFVSRFAESILWESPIQVRALMEVLSGTLQVRIQAYRYLAFMPDRRPKAISVISGTGIIPVSGW